MKVKEKNFISVVIYVHNAKTEIERFLTNAIDFLENNFEHSEIICVNDHSTDESVNIIKSVCKERKCSCISIVNLSHFHGLEAAMSGGVNLAIGDFVFEIDDVSLIYDMDALMTAYKKALEGYDIVAAVPTDRTGVLSGLFYSLFNKMRKSTFKIRPECFRVISRRAMNRVGNMTSIVTYRKAVYANCGLKYGNIYIKIDRSHGRPMETEEKKYRKMLALDSLLMFTHIGFNLAIFLSGMMMLILVLLAVYALVMRFQGVPVEGWTSTVLVLAFGFSGLFGILSIVVKYLQLILDIQVKQNNFIFESVEKLSK